MLTVASFLVALLAFWAYVRWDARRLKGAPVPPIERAEMERGYKPRGIVKWQAYLGVGFMFALLAFGEWQAPSHPPFTGRWGAVKSIAFGVLGSKGLMALYLAIAAGFVAAALVHFRESRR